MFFDKVSNNEARRLIAAGRKAYEYKTKDPAKGPVFGPGYDDPGELNRAKRGNRYAETVDAAQQCAKSAGTTITEVIFLTGR